MTIWMETVEEVVKSLGIEHPYDERELVARIERAVWDTEGWLNDKNQTYSWEDGYNYGLTDGRDEILDLVREVDPDLLDKHFKL